MSDSKTQPVPNSEEIEAALANLDPKLARMLRPRLGLPPAEPEPPGGPDSAAAAIRQHLAGIDPTARAIDPEALSQIDAEIKEQEKAKAEQEAARAMQPVPLGDAVATALEPAKARARRLSPVRRRMIESSIKIGADLPDDVVYQHSVLCQTVLPYRDPGPEVRKWERQQGGAYLQITAGEIADKRQGKFVPVGLPYGPAARLLIAHLNTAALQIQKRVIEVENSMTAYIRRLTGHQTRGADIRRFKEQLVRLSSSIFRIAYDVGERTVQTNANIVDTFDLWEEGFEGERFLFPQTIALSERYFDNLLAHAVPLDERAMAALAHSAMGLDVYAWLAQRLHRVDPQRPQFVAWTGLHAQFGQGYDRIRKFREVFLGVLKAVRTQYPAARIKTDKTGVLLAHSTPPVPSRRLFLISPAKPPKE